MDELSPVARRMGNINTVTCMPDGRLRGDNTDYYGFKVLIESLELELEGKKAVVFGGTGGAGSTAMMVLADLGMDAVAIERAGENTYENLERHANAALAVNCTPVGLSLIHISTTTRGSGRTTPHMSCGRSSRTAPGRWAP